MALIQSRMSLLELLQLQTGHDHDHCGNNEVSHYLYIYIYYIKLPYLSHLKYDLLLSRTWW